MVAEPLHTAPPILRALEGVRRELDTVADVPATFLRVDDKRTALAQVTQVEARLAELRLRLVDASTDVAETDGTRDVAAWLTRHTHCSRTEGRATQRIAAALDRWQRVRHGMRDGAVSLAQAQVVTRALDALPADVPDAVVDQAEHELVALCDRYGPDELRRLGRRILDLVAPDLYDDAEARRLAEEEQAVRDRARLSLTPCGDGTTRLRATLPDVDASRLRTYLEAFTSPRSATPAGEGGAIPYPRRLAHAFSALLEHLDPARLPHHGGDATTVVVTVTLDQLRRELGTAELVDADDTSITAGQARRLACTARLVPAVLGTDSEILDLGRSTRLYQPAQRKAMRLRDRHCRADGCTVPATWCEAHHLEPWHTGGRTDLDDGVLLCNWHHHRIHDPRYEAETRPDGQILIRRRRC